MSELISAKSEQGKAHGPDWLKWLAPFVGQPGVVGLELGCWLGESTEFFLEHVCTDPTSSMVTIDTFQGSAEHHLAGIDCANNEEAAKARLARFGRRANVCVGTTAEWLRVLNSPKVSFIYVDASHDAMNVLRDSVLSFELLQVGGVIIWDDMNWEVMEQEIDRPKMAIDAFVSCYGRQLEIIGKGWQVAARRTG